MSKKKNKKFKKHPVAAKETITQIPDQNKTVSAAEPAPTSAKIEETKSKEPDNLSEKYSYVKRDVNKLLITIGVLALLFVGIYFLQTKTTLLSTVGDWIYKVGHFSI